MRLAKYQCPFGPNFVLGLSPAAWFRADTGVTVTGQGASQVNDQANSDHALVLPGVAGNYASTPDSAANSITGDIDIRVRVALDDWTPSAAQRLVQKGYAAPNRAYTFEVAATTGVLVFGCSSDGTAATVAASSTSAPAISDGAALWVRVTRSSSTGDVKFYTASDSSSEPASWTQLGTTVSAAASAIFNSGNALEVGAMVSASSYTAGKIYRASIYSTIGGTTPVVDFNAADFTKGSTSATSSTTGEVWTVNQSGNPPAHIGNKYDLLQGTDASRPPYLSYSGTKYLYLSGVSGNYASTPDSVPASITGDIDIRVRVALDDWTPSATKSFVSKLQSLGQYSWQFTVTNTGGNGFLSLWDSTDGSTLTAHESSVGTGFTDGATKWVRATRVASSGAIKYYTAADSATEPTSWTQLGADVSGTAGAFFDGTSIIEIGSNLAGTGNNVAGEVYRAIIKSGIDGTTVVDFNPDLDGSDQAATITSSATGEVWTINKSGGLPAQIVGRPSLLFDGTADYLKCNAFTLNQPETVYLAFKQVSWTLNEYIFDGNATNSGALFQSATTPNIKAQAGTQFGENSGLPVGSYGVVAVVFKGASTSLIQVNNAAPVTGSSGAVNMGGFTLGTAGTPGVYGNIQVLEAIIFPTAHDATQRARVIQYLAGRHGIAL